jgi:hypothetical protein
MLILYEDRISASGKLSALTPETKRAVWNLFTALREDTRFANSQIELEA